MMENEKIIITICGIIVIFYILLLFLRNNREKQKSDLLVTALMANKLTLEMVQIFLEDPKSMEEEIEIVKKAVNTAIKKDEELIDITLVDILVKNNLCANSKLNSKKGDKNEQ